MINLVFWLLAALPLVSFVHPMPTSTPEVISRINQCIDEAVVIDEDGNCFPHVCIVCDHLLKKEDDKRISSATLRRRKNTLRADGHAGVTNPLLIKSYDFSGKIGSKPWMNQVLLSPRANYKGGKARGSKSTYSCCEECKTSLERGVMPVYAIANKHTYGDLPEPLEALNEVEWSLLTPVKGTGYGSTFVYTGGYMKTLKGVLSYQRVDEEMIARAVLQLEALGLNGHIVVLFTGKMTPDQKKMAKARTEIRVDVVLNALKWLVVNNKMWRHVKLDEIRAWLNDLKPTVVDESETVGGSDTVEGSNVETTRTFAAYFPDGSMKPIFGGHASIDEFRKMVERSQTRMADLKFHCDLMRETVPDYRDDNFARACMMQMPFGGGGMHEERFNADGKVTTGLDLMEWVKHLSKISIPRFHNPLFVGTRHRHLPTFDEKEEVEMQEANGTARSIVDWATKSRIDKKQRRTFEILAATFVLTFYDEAVWDKHHPLRTTEFIKEHKNLKKLSARNEAAPSLIAFIHGPGGSGKTTIIDLVKLYSEEFCGHLNHPFTNETIVITAITGVAATILLGETTDRAIHLNRDNIDPELISDWVDTRLLIIDEVSFTAPAKISKIDEHLRILLKKPSAKFGGMNVVFAGDLRQLKAVNQPSIIEQPCPELDHWTNFYIELEGLHRFKDDKEWGRILIRFRDGVPTLDDFSKINERVVTEETELPQNIKYATHRNAERDAINAAVFETHCTESAAVNNGTATDSILIFSDNIQVKTSRKNKRPLINRSLFWQGCGEDDLKAGGKKTSERVDPVLKLFHGCQVMLTKNDDVKAAKANGTRAIFKEVLLKQGEQPFFVEMGGVKVPAVLAFSVRSATFEHVNEDVRPRTFSMTPKKFHTTARFPNSRQLMSSTDPKDRTLIPIELQQLPVVSNTATTGHKLQGSGVDNLFVSEWYNEASWIYVILSRVKTRAGLFLRKELEPNIDLYKIPETLTNKLQYFRKNCTRPELDESDYKDLCAPCHH